jgi:hypothetical protein
MMIGAGLTGFKETKNLGKGLAAFSAIIRLLCLIVETPRCTLCGKRTRYFPNIARYFCDLCGLYL